MANFKSVLSYFSTLPNEQKGSAFELYCKWYLENEPIYKSQLKHVWLWQDWPGKWGRDKGIDLIVETKRGEIWAIQAKAYDSTYPITKQDIDTFLSESSRPEIAHRLLIATTDKLGQNAREVINGQEKRVSIRLLYQLLDAQLDWPVSLDTLYPSIPIKPKDPRPHQQEAIMSILNGFKASSIGQVHMACGTGKTLVGLWVARALQCKNVLVLLPSISLVSQLHKEWVANSGDFNFDPIFVCSDPTVAYDKDQMVAHLAELGYPVTTNAQELCKQMKQSDEANVVFATYHSSGVIAEACALDPSLIFDLAIADEAHRCAGPKSSAFTTIVDKDAIRANRKLFMTATPKYFTDRVKRITHEHDFEIVSMDEEKKFGPVFYSLPFSVAIKQDLLSDYQVIIAVMDNATYQEYADRGRFVNIEGHETDARTLASQILVAKTMKKYGLKKVISFHSRKKSAKEFIDLFDEVNQFLPDHEQPKVGFLKTIFGEMPQQDRNIIMRQFKEAAQHHAGLIGNVKCLSEGVDVPAIDGIAFVDPKSSEIDIIQTVGRAIRKSEDKTIGTIIIPIFIDSDTDEDELFNKSCFRPVWQVIKALRAQDDTFAEELDNVRLELGSRSYRKPSSLTKIVIDVPEKIDFKFCDNVKTKIVEQCGIVSLAKSHSELAKQWHPTKNGYLTPSEVIAGSHKKAWWFCDKGDDHEWEAMIDNRSRHAQGCPVCAGQKVVMSNCLANTHPELSSQWHSTKNDNTTPYDVTKGSSKQTFWWQCPLAGDHVWQATVSDRSNGKGCPMCSGRKASALTCLPTTHPEIAKQWHPTKNIKLKLQDVKAGSGKMIWWLCTKGHEWQMPVYDRTGSKRGGCPFCSNRRISNQNCLSTTHPELTRQWHPEKNGCLAPNDFVAGSNEKVWWKCPVADDHEWQALIISRKNGQSCSICAGKKVVRSNCLATTHPELVKQWHQEKNAALNLTPYGVTHGSGKKPWWQCVVDNGHEWQASINKRTSGRGCPHCYKENRRKKKTFK